MGQGVDGLETCTGGCHSGAVGFEIRAPDHLEVVDCNCSICSMSGYRHLFCRHCGVKSFYTPRSNPDGVDVNLHCLDSRRRGVSALQFDGRNREKNAHKSP